MNDAVTNLTSFDSQPLASILDYHVTLGGSSEFGRVTDGFIRIRGNLTQATFCASDEELRRRWDEQDAHELVLRTKSSRQTIVVPVLMPDIRLGIPSVVDEETPCYPTRDAIGSRNFYLLSTCENENGLTGIVLQSTDTGIRGQYRRLGAFNQLKEEKESFLAFQSHVPLLHAQEYEQSDSYGSTISII